MSFELSIVSVESEIYRGTVKKLFATGVQGELEILANHAPLLTSLSPGPVWVVDLNDREEAFVMFGGMLEVHRNQVTILADSVLRAKEIDESAAMTAKQNIESSMTNKDGKVDYAKAHGELAMAIAQLRVIRKIRNQLR